MKDMAHFFIHTKKNYNFSHEKIFKVTLGTLLPTILRLKLFLGSHPATLEILIL